MTIPASHTTHHYATHARRRLAFPYANPSCSVLRASIRPFLPRPAREPPPHRNGETVASPSIQKRHGYSRRSPPIPETPTRGPLAMRPGCMSASASTRDAAAPARRPATRTTGSPSNSAERPRQATRFADPFARSRSRTTFGRRSRARSTPSKTSPARRSNEIHVRMAASQEHRGVARRGAAQRVEGGVVGTEAGFRFREPDRDASGFDRGTEKGRDDAERGCRKVDHGSAFRSGRHSRARTANPGDAARRGHSRCSVRRLARMLRTQFDAIARAGRAAPAGILPMQAFTCRFP